MRFLQVGFVIVLGASTLPAENLDPALAGKAAKILADNCSGCHGAALQNSKLDLRTRESLLRGGERGPALTPGKAEQSRLYRYIAHLDQPAMPPGRKLADQEIATLKLWIDQGAPYTGIAEKEEDARAALAKLEERSITPAERKWWAFQKPVRRDPPPTQNQTWARNTIDRFLLSAMEKKDIRPSPEADRRTLVRRAYLDLTGLPPSPQQTAAFLNDQRPDAFDRLVDQLLDSPQYGERWARHWLDLVRFADSGGFENDIDRKHAWRYRDYVVDAFNKDKPYDVFLKEQLAGDEIYPNSREAWVATGYLRLGVEPNMKNEQTRIDELDDIVVTTSNAMLGVTVGCARCHNHKFDPIPQKDYYRMQAVFFPTKGFERPLASEDEIARHKAEVKRVDALEAPVKEQMRIVEQPFRDKIMARRRAAFPEYLRIALATPEDKRTEGQKLNVQQVEKSIGSIPDDELLAEMPPAARASRALLIAQIAELERQKPEMPVAMAIKEEGREPAPSYFLHRGSLGQKGSVMGPGVLSVVTEGDWRFPEPSAEASSSFRRRGFAEWLTQPDHPLTARVMVNRIWQNHFGEGLVRTPSNFGRMGERPSHPELLDWLATEFVQNNWSVKHIHRLLMTSSAYRAASDDIEGNRKLDPDNRLLWRMPRRRLEGEAIRDSILQAAGTLNTKLGGPAVFPYIDPALFQASSKRTWKGQPVNDPSTYRRSLYVFSKRTIPLPMLEVFDRPDTIISCGRRNRSTIAPQALILMNNEFVGIQAKHFAQRLQMEAGADAERQIQLAYEIALARPPRESELKLAKDFINGSPQGLVDFCHALFNINEFVYVP